jgi:predicted ArsR family transcriptional regulator
MKTPHERFLDSTRGRVLALLRKEAMTVDDIAARLELTDNAVRLHLTSLERDGLVRSVGVRRGGPGKPAVLYGVDAHADTELSRAYAPVVAALTDELATRLSPRELRTVFRKTGERLAADAPRPEGSLLARARAAARWLTQLGAAVSVQEDGDDVVLRGEGCPISAVVGSHREACAAVESAVAAVTGATVREQCERGERPRCRMRLDESA